MYFFIVAAISLLFLYFYYKDTKLPPGPISPPIVGYVPFLGRNPLSTVQKLCNKYGPVMKLNLLGENFYFLNTVEAVNEAFKNEGPIFAGRPQEFSLLNVFEGNSLLCIEGEEWKIMQKFFLSKLSGLGMGKTDFAFKIHDLCDDLIDNIKQSEEINELNKYLLNFTSNVISYLLFRLKHKINDPIYEQLVENIKAAASSGTDLDLYYTGNVIHLLSRFNVKQWNALHELSDRIHGFMKELLKERLNNARNDEECKDVLDFYLKEQNGSNSDLFENEGLIRNFVLMFNAGADTTSSSLTFMMHFMANNNEVQQKVYNEIDSVFGKDHRITMSDMEKLNFTRAVIAESQRFACVLPLSFTHVNKQAATVCGFLLPKRSKVIANIYRLTRDKQYFENPEHFDVNNFLDQDGTFKPNDANIPFGVGTRKCLGQRLAEMQLCIGFTRLIQQFQWLPPKDKHMNFEDQVSVTRHLLPFQIIAKKRF